MEELLPSGFGGAIAIIAMILLAVKIKEPSKSLK